MGRVQDRAPDGAIWQRMIGRRAGVQHTRTIRQAKGDLSRRLFRIPGVVGIGIGLGDDRLEQLVVLLEEDDPQLRAQIPGSIDGYPVVIEITGRITSALAPRPA